MSVVKLSRSAYARAGDSHTVSIENPINKSRTLGVVQLQQEKKSVKTKIMPGVSG